MTDETNNQPSSHPPENGHSEPAWQPIKYVYQFAELEEVEARTGGDWGQVKQILGGKGANLARMTALGIPVPPGFVVTTEACNAYLAASESFPEGLWTQEIEAVHAIEKASGRGFGDPERPLLLSCRSGASISMPGMMDTILNIGLNDHVVEGMIAISQQRGFVYNLYRRLLQMFGSTVLGVPDEIFEAVITAQCKQSGVANDFDLGADDWQTVTFRFKEIIASFTGKTFPDDPYEQLRLATEAVFKSWQGKRAIDYRTATNIPHDLGTAVNVQTMVFGNLDDRSATGVAMSRNATTGEPELEGDFLMRAQGEDVVAGIRKTQPLAELRQYMPEVFDEFAAIAKKLEAHYQNMQDMEFTVEHGKLWILQTRDGKRTAQSEVRIAVDMVAEGLISREEAVRRVQPDQVDYFLHPQLEESARKASRPIAAGLNVSPGAAVGMVVFDADTAEQWAKEKGQDVIMVRPETKPDDVHGILAAEGILTSRGGRTSHASLVARQFGKPAVVGVSELEIDLEGRMAKIGDHTIKEGDWLSLDGGLGLVYAGKMLTVTPEFNNPHLLQLLEWADEFRRLAVWANADNPIDAKIARGYGAQGIGLCRTEHMFFETSRLPIMQQMIMAELPTLRQEAITKLLPHQRSDFEGLFKAMDGLPVIIRLLDPPLHEFLPTYEDLIEELADLKFQLHHHKTLGDIDQALEEIRNKQALLGRVEALREANPMLGTRGVRLGILILELTKMQVRAIFEAACKCAKQGIDVHPEVMIPLTAHVNELRVQQTALEQEAKAVMAEQGMKIKYRFGTMIEIPRAALTADEIAEVAQFFSFGTNDLTQTTFGISRDDAEAGFLLEYQQRRILVDNPFDTIDTRGVGKLMAMAVRMGRATNPDLELGICGEHGGDPRSIAFCHDLGLDYVSCSAYRVPIARLAAAHAALAK